MELSGKTTRVNFLTGICLYAFLPESLAKLAKDLSERNMFRTKDLDDDFDQNRNFPTHFRREGFM